jgi:hypothetical protein
LIPGVPKTGEFYFDDSGENSTGVDTVGQRKIYGIPVVRQRACGAAIDGIAIKLEDANIVNSVGARAHPRD